MVHMVGIGGTGMSSAARLLLARGCTVSGSDRTLTGVTAELAALGAKVSIGHDRYNIPLECDLVVTTAAAAADNPELIEAGRRKLHVIKYARLLGLLMKGKLGIGVAGTHGKTTTSSMLVDVLRAGGISTSYVIGGKVIGHGGNDCAGSSEFFVAEACEYDRSFLNLAPVYAIITNLEPDHLDYYKNESNLMDAFREFAGRLPEHGILLVGGDSPRALEAARSARCKVETFGVREDCDWRVATVDLNSKGYAFGLEHNGSSCDFELSVPGYHNVLNATAAAALALSLGVSRSAVAAGLASFRGVERRFQVLTDGLPITVIDDYAHHPTEIAAALGAAREMFPGHRIWAVFQAHQHSRTRTLFEEFARSLIYADRVTIARIFSVRESDLDRKSVNGGDIAGRLFQLSVDSEYVPGFRDIESLLLSEAREGDVVVVMGAGDIYQVAHSFARKLTERPSRVLTSAKSAV
jgi:UDP-N-acetylmuramate--alanine ligase